MGKPVYMVSGSKGGVGKSIVSMSLIHYLSKRDEKLLLIDADTANPDVGKTYGKTVETIYINLDEKDRRMDLVNRLAVQPDETVVVNTPAHSGVGVKLYGTLLTESMQELGRKLVTLRVSQRQPCQGGRVIPLMALPTGDLPLEPARHLVFDLAHSTLPHCHCAGELAAPVRE